MDVEDEGSSTVMEGELDPQEVVGEELELKGDALNDGASDCVSAAGSRFSLTSRASPSPRASLRNQQSSVNRRRGRSEATYLTAQPSSRRREGSVGSASPAESQVSSLSVNTPTRSTRSASTTAPSVDPRGDQELLQLMTLGDPLELTLVDLSVATKKTKKALKSLQSLGEYINITELNVANNAIASLDGVEMFEQVTVLNVSRNHVKKIDPSLFSLVQLRSLDLSGNFISHIPRGIAALEVLEVLNLSGNNLSALKEIDVLGKLVNLHTCNLAANPFCKLPTYKDYVVSKLLSLERLDECGITDQVRDKSRRRFSEEMFSKEKCIRDAGIAHASEQTKLREVQLALEAENSKLKDELQLKSKLLQNKSRAWSSATEQLLQLQHDLAMMNLDRRQSSGNAGDPVIASIRISARDGPASNQPDHDEGGTDHHDGSAAHVMVAHSHSPSRQNSKTLAPGKQDAWDDRRKTYGTSPLRKERGLTTYGDCSPPRTSSVDAACSPFLQAGRTEAKQREPCVIEKGMSVPPSPGPMRHHEEHNEDDDAFYRGMLSPHDYTSRVLQDSVQLQIDDENEACEDQLQTRPSLRFPTFEDDSGCPAYDDPGLLGSTQIYDDHVQRPMTPQKVDLNTRASTTIHTSPLHSPQSRVMWEKQRAKLAQETSRGSPKKTPKRSQVIGLVEKENLVRQIQALQSCKQSFVAEIAKEEQLLHELKRECSTYSNQIERLESDMQVLVGASSRGRTGITSHQREEETIRAKLEMLRNKLHYAEDKEGEIEATIVRLTKRVLEEDIQLAKEYSRSFSTPQAGNGAFDKEIFALTHNLQLVIVEKEEVHSEMSRLMNQLRSGSTDGGNLQQSTGLSAEVLLMMDQHEQLQRVTAENQAAFLDKQRKVDELKRKLRDVHDRIKIKEQLLASLVTELKDVESELAYINEITPQTPRGHRRSLSLDSLPSSSGEASPNTYNALPATSVSITRLENPNSPRRATSSPRNSSRPGGPTDLDTHESISTMVEAAAADVNNQFEQKFKELFSPDVLESIKKDIYEKLSQQLPSTSARPRAAPDEGVVDLHAAIAAALDTHMKKAMESFEKQRNGQVSQSEQGIPPASPKKQNTRGNTGASQPTHQDASGDRANNREIERKCWDEVDDFIPIPEANYASRYRFVKEQALSVTSLTASGKCVRTGSAQRIQKACERLEQAELDCNIDTFSGIETDNSGRKKSDLKVVVIGARDLPTSHLRTKNLDPYVALEIVYPQHVRPQAKPATVRLNTPMTLAQNRTAYIDEPTQPPNQSFRSRTIKMSVYPVWDEEFEFSPVHSLKGYLHVRVLNDRKLSREQLVGETKIPLRMLVDQKKMIESFVLNTSASGSENGSSRRNFGAPKTASNGSSGTIRIQLQLSFSRIEKFKRAVDELVTKYVDEYNVLPPFIERIDRCEPCLAAPTEETNPESDPADVGGAAGTCLNAQPLPSFDSWKAQQPTSESSDSTASESEIQDSQPSSVNGCHPPKVSVSEVTIGRVEHTSSLSSTRSAALWSTPSSAHVVDTSSKSNSSESFMNDRAKDNALRAGSSVRPPKSALAPSQSAKKVNPPASTSAKAAMAQLRQMVNASKPTQAMTSVQKAGAGFSILNNANGNRRKTMSSTVPSAASSMSPDCFDDYSPYHPDFQLLDPLGIESMGMGGIHPSHGKARSTSYSGGFHRHGSGDDRRTDLRIFKSPGFSRREPSGGFPERFIGLDTQTSERIKRIFGRIDNQA